MKAVLILLNILLSAGVFFSVMQTLRQTKEAENDEYFFRKGEKKPNASSPAIPAKAIGKPKAETVSAAALTAKITEGNMFDPARCPNARIPGRRNNNTRLEMTLVGTFTFDNHSGAIILQKKQSNQNSFPGMMPMMGPPMMPNGAGNPNPGGPNPGNARMRFGPWMMRQNNLQNGSTAEETPVVYQQYVRVGETLANGYKLVSVTRTSAVLAKNSERLELELVEASKNAGAAKSAAAKNTGNTGNNRGMFPPMMMGQPPPGMMGGNPGDMRGGMMGNPGNQNNQSGPGRTRNRRNSNSMN